jgi:hypothetical protein
LLAFLETLPAAVPAEPMEPSTKIVRGRKVRTTYTPLSAEEERAREDAMIKKVADAMKKPTRRLEP